MDDLTGRVLGGRYRVESFLGRGGMADVYKVWDDQRAAHLAMKLLHDDLAEDVVFLRRFKREAHLLERLQHPNIVRFYGVDESDGLAFILMDYIDGLTLRREIFLSKQGMDPKRMLQLLRPVCAALYYAHQMGMVHCDIKPANVMIHRSSMVYLADFGIARFTENNTTTMMGAGTPAYMAPEQLMGKESTPASDIYAMGVMLFEMITGGERPFTGEMAQNAGNTTQKIIWEKRYLPPPSPRKFRPDLAPELEAVVMRCLSRDPVGRYATALDLLHALESAVYRATQETETLTLADLEPLAGDESEIPHPPLDLDEAPQEAAAQRAGAQRADALRASAHRADAHKADEPALLDAIPALELDGTSDGDDPITLPEEEPDQGQPPQKAGRTAHVSIPLPILVGVVILIAVLAVLSAQAFQRGAGGIAGSTNTPPQVANETATAAVLGARIESHTPTPTQAPPSPTPTVTSTPEPTPLGGGVPGGSGRIAFASDRGGSVQIWTMNPSGRNHRQLTTVEGGACQPAWSPDGKKIAFITPCNGPRITYPGASLRILDLESGQITVPNFHGGGFDPAWSPDGKTIAFTALNGTNTEIHALNVEDGTTTVLARRGNKSTNPAWSPDGEHLVFTTADKNGVDVLWLMRKDGGSQEPFSQAGLLKYFNQATWSPDGRWIMATMRELNVNVLNLVRFDFNDPLKGETPLMDELFNMEDGSFSPDGKWVVFWAKVDGSNLEIIRVNVEDGSEQVRLASNAGRDFQAAWGPPGSLP